MSGQNIEKMLLGCVPEKKTFAEDFAKFIENTFIIQLYEDKVVKDVYWNFVKFFKTAFMWAIGSKICITNCNLI